MASDSEITIAKWYSWYTKKYPNAVEKATDKIYEQVQNLRNAIPLIDRDMVKRWLKILLQLRHLMVCMYKKLFWHLLLNVWEHRIALLHQMKNLLVLMDM